MQCPHRIKYACIHIKSLNQHYVVLKATEKKWVLRRDLKFDSEEVCLMSIPPFHTIPQFWSYGHMDKKTSESHTQQFFSYFAKKQTDRR